MNANKTVLPRDFQRLLSGDRRTAAIVVDTRFSKSQRDVEAFLGFVDGCMSVLTEEDKQELFEQARKDARKIRDNKFYGTERENWSGR